MSELQDEQLKKTQFELLQTKSKAFDLSQALEQSQTDARSFADILSEVANVLGVQDPKDVTVPGHMAGLIKQLQPEEPPEEE